MQKYVKVYLKAFGYQEGDWIPCENEECWWKSEKPHHIIFKSQWGWNDIKNLCWLCRPCHERAHFRREPYLREDEVRTIHHKFMINAWIWE